MHKLIFSIFIAILLNTSVVQASPSSLTLKGLDGKSHSADEYIGKGKWVLVNIWGPRCPPCVDEMAELQNFHDDHKNKDAIVLGIALDFPGFGPAIEKEVRDFTENYFISFPVLLGDANSITLLGGGLLKGTPTSLIYSPEGKLEAIRLGTVTQQLIEEYLLENSKK